MSLERFNRIGILLQHHPLLMDFLFDRGQEPYPTELRDIPEQLLQNPFSSGEKVLVRVALDIWNGCGDARVLDLPRLSENNLRALFHALNWNPHRYTGPSDPGEGNPSFTQSSSKEVQ